MAVMAYVTQILGYEQKLLYSTVHETQLGSTVNDHKRHDICKHQKLPRRLQNNEPTAVRLHNSAVASAQQVICPSLSGKKNDLAEGKTTT